MQQYSFKLDALGDEHGIGTFVAALSLEQDRRSAGRRATIYSEECYSDICSFDARNTGRSCLFDWKVAPSGRHRVFSVGTDRSLRIHLAAAKN